MVDRRGRVKAVVRQCWRALKFKIRKVADEGFYSLLPDVDNLGFTFTGELIRVGAWSSSPVGQEAGFLGHKAWVSIGLSYVDSNVIKDSINRSKSAVDISRKQLNSSNLKISIELKTN
ncbi:hypothetical protein EUGRSUZ_H02377 [Eucalyptus grandis]|uniref:Uncharacterized protein n=2 Tax=Eucalyptus grandis TaxID=71139 RepID=A0ACC3JRR3_EUCGR|nr:hypothetical protein EUGRSUZ_H02377 [Eucalyptus grandis]